MGDSVNTLTAEKVVGRKPTNEEIHTWLNDPENVEKWPECLRGDKKGEEEEEDVTNGEK